MDCFATHLPNELDQIKQTLGIDPCWLNFSYYTIEDFQSENCSSNNKKEQLLLGNSATASNNHIEALSALKSIDYKGRISCPLSYGDNIYRETLCKKAKEHFPDTFVPLTEYLPLEQYNKHIAESSVMVMNHYRQQALGNIITALWYGTRVFVSNRSPALSHFKKLGCIIHSVEDDLSSNSNLTALSDIETQTNRSKLSKAYAAKTFIESIQSMDKKFRA